jgi:hypothetical protein
MIHHVSISAKNPQHVAGVLAELMGGKCYPFPGRLVDSFMAVGDNGATMIEVYPEPVTLEPGTGDEQVNWGTTKSDVGYAPFHILLSVPLDEAAVQRIGDREGWRTRRFGRGAPGQKPFFDVIEVWVENRLMIEVATADMLPAYQKMIAPGNLEVLFGSRAAAE